jgi:hypothetical protein
MKKYQILSWLLVVILLSKCLFGFSQTIYITSISGRVIDAKTRTPIPFASAILENTTVGTVTDDKGMYSILTGKTAYKITFSFLGYKSESVIVTPGKVQVINVELSSSSVELGEVQVKATRKSYSNKNNPSVDLIEKVIKHKTTNRKENLDYYNYEKYEKIVFELSNVSDKFEQSRLFSKFHFIFDNVDSSRIDGKDNIPLFIKEIQSGCFYRQNPKAEKEIIHGEKTINFDEYIDSKGLTANINYLYQNINIYDNDIFFMSNKFLSPLALTAPVLYRYYIQDTSLVEGDRCIKLFFEPRNPADFLFHGFLYITDDSTYAIRKIDISLNKKINIDWIRDVRIIQDFKELGNNTWLLSKDEVAVDFGVAQGLPGVLGRRTVSYNDYSVNKIIQDSIFKGPDKVRDNDAYNKNTMYWESVRKPPLYFSEKNLYGIIDSVKKVPSFKRDAKIIVLLSTNFLELGKVEIGPDVSFLSFNPIEGTRFRFGGRTTPQFNKNIYFDSYLAYGTHDKQYKYNITTTYSIHGTSIYKFPVNAIHLTCSYETKIPGQELLYSGPDNIFYSFKRGVNDKMVYNRSFSLGYLNEFENHFSFGLGYTLTRETPAGSLYFTSSDSLPQVNQVPFLKISEVALNLQYAPREEFYQGKTYRSRIPSKYPVLNASFIVGSKFLGNDYNYQKLDVGISKRFYLSIIGYTDVTADAGRIFGKVPYPLLFIHNANQSYAYQTNTYNMMNFMEFVSDKYATLLIDHSFNGFFFNKVPLLKKLKLREVASLKVLYGEVSDRNNPALQPDLFKFPTENNGIPLTYALGSKPYIEGSVGVSNLFRVLRVDLVKRITYLQNPNVASLGVRVLFKLDF